MCHKNGLQLLSDGRLFVDNGQTVQVFDGGFCVEWLVDASRNISVMSAFVCSSVATQKYESPTARKPSGCLAGLTNEV
jgi:hypothetical protein